jgi:hypothetical protein
LNSRSHRRARSNEPGDTSTTFYSEKIMAKKNVAQSIARAAALAKLLAAAHSADGATPLDPAEVQTIGEQIAELCESALEAAQQ